MNLSIQRFAIKLAETLITHWLLWAVARLGAGDKELPWSVAFPSRDSHSTHQTRFAKERDSWTRHTLLMYCTTSWMYDRIISVFSLKVNDKEIITCTHPSSTNMGTAGFQMKVYGTLNFLLTAARKIQLVSSDRGQVLPKVQALFSLNGRKAVWQYQKRR